MADDICALIDHLGLEQPDVVGHSLGGGAALFTAVKCPAKVRRMVMISANITRLITLLWREFAYIAQD